MTMDQVSEYLRSMYRDPAFVRREYREITQANRDHLRDATKMVCGLPADAFAEDERLLRKGWIE